MCVFVLCICSAEIVVYFLYMLCKLVQVLQKSTRFLSISPFVSVELEIC